MRLLRCNGRTVSIVGYRRPAVVFIAIVILLFVCACSPKEERAAVPVRRGWVNDYAGMLGPEENARLGAVLESYEKETCHQIFVLIIPTLAGENIEKFSKRTATAWEIGQPGFGNGFLVSIAMKEGTVRIETGSAFEWFIANGTADKILKDVMFPLFRQNRFVDGLERGLEEIMAAGRLKPIPENHKPDTCGR